MEYIGKDIYCDLILSKKINITLLKETENVLAFYHTNPRWKIHIVVLSKKHIDSFLTLNREDQEILLELIEIIKQISNKVVQENGAAKILTNLGKYQDSKHLHFHIISGEEIKKIPHI